MKPKLFDDDSESETENVKFTTNKDYANSYNKFRSKELLKKLKDRNQTNSDSDSDDSSSDSDDNDTITNPKFDEAFFKTLASLKSKDPSVYDLNTRFFDETNSKVSAEQKTAKPITVKDYERNLLLERGGIIDDDDESDAIERPQSPTYVEQQQKLKNDIIMKTNASEDSEDEKWGGIFQKRTKTKEEEAEGEANYTKWLAGEQANIGENAKTLKPLKEYWDNPKLSKDEVFLRDYILNNGYSQQDEDQVPTYDDIVGPNDIELSEDEAELEKQAEFEHKYNFRFEEPDQEFIKRYPRTVDHSVRKVDTRRKEKRQEVKERKTQEKEQKMRELEMLNAMRRKEIEEKMNKLKSVSGTDALPFDDNDLDEDFDPDEYDRKMQEIFNNEYYQIDEGENKPECPDDIDDLKVEDWDNYDPNDVKAADDGLHCEDDEFNMDCDYDAEHQQVDAKKSFETEMIESTRDKRKRRKRRSKFVEMLQTRKPVFDQDAEKTYGEYLDEYYKLDYEDIIGDVPCRFKYVETVPNDFGLSIEEILMAKNKELNQWASLKKATQIRPENVEKGEVKMFQMKSKNLNLKKKIFVSIYGDPSDDENAENDDKDEEKSKTIKNDSKKLPKMENKSKPSSTVTSAPQEIVISKESSKAETVMDIIENSTNECKIEKPSQKIELKLLDEPKKNLKVKNSTPPKKVVSGPIKKPVTPKQIKLNKVKINENKTVNQLKQKNAMKVINKVPKKVNKNQQNKPDKSNNTSIGRSTTKSNQISDERLRAFGINPKKFHKKNKYLSAKPKTGGAMSAGKKQTALTSQQKKQKLKLKKFLEKTK